MIPPVDIINPDTPTTINNPGTPEGIGSPARPTSTVSWALLNLVLTIATGLIMALLLAAYVVRRRNGDDNGFLPLRLVTVATTIVAIITFVVTQDTSGTMVLTDNWTPMHVVTAVVAAVFGALSSRKHREEEDYI